MDEPGSASWTGDLWGGLAAMLVALTLWNDPGNVYLHCLCEAP